MKVRRRLREANCARTLIGRVCIPVEVLHPMESSSFAFFGAGACPLVSYAVNLDPLGADDFG